MRHILERQRAAFLRDGPPSAAARRDALLRLKRLLTDHQDDVAAAVSADFGHRSWHETLMADVFTTVAGIKHARRHLGAWMRPERRAVPVYFRPGRARVVYQPLGVVGIISPWNYPVGLALAPLTAALAAGNRAMLKPSEFTPSTSALLARLLAETFPEEQVAVVTGGPEVGAAFSALPFDHLFFTGSAPVGQAILRAASEHLVPVTLELGGKSPALVGPGFPVERAARSIAHGKLLNAGQTCVAPDYALVPEAMVATFAEAFARQAARLYPRLLDNPDYSSIVSPAHRERLVALVEDARAKGARVLEINPAGEDFGRHPGRKFPPTLLLDTTHDMTVMQREIFGPILPVRPYRDIAEAIAYINDRPRPLALYYFDLDRERRRTVLARTTSGGVSINDTLLQYLQEDLPFGGIGSSGMGAYHGREGFLLFSHSKAVFEQSRLNLADLFRPPYRKHVARLVGALMR